MTPEPGEPVYVRRDMTWSETMELGRNGVAAYVLDAPTSEDFELYDDPSVVVFVPIDHN